MKKTKTIEEIDALRSEIDDFLSKYKELKYLLYETINDLKIRRADFVRRAKEEAEADELKIKIDELLTKLAHDKKLVPEVEELVSTIKEMIEKELKFTDKFEVLVRRLEIALRHERLVSQSDHEGFAWQSEKVRIDNSKVKLNKFHYTKMLGHNTEVRVVRFDEEKKFMMTCDKSGIVKIYIYETMEEIRSFKVTGSINDAIFTGSPENVVIALESGNLELWNIALREQIAIIKQFNKPVLSLAYYNDCVYCGGANTNIEKIKLKNIGIPAKKLEFEEVGVFDDARGKINSIAISPDKNFIAAGSSDNIVYVWKLSDPSAENMDSKKSYCSSYQCFVQ